MSIRIGGLITAMLTPMDKEGNIDYTILKQNINWQIGQGVNGLVPVGTTGESPTVSHDEHNKIVDITVQEAAGRVPIIAGAGSNNTTETIILAKHAEKSGADAVLVIAPYYNKPTQEGLFQHFKHVSEAISIPIIVYNVPGRCVVDIMPETLARIAEFKNVIGVKDATGEVDRVSRHRELIGKDFIQLSGEDASILGYMAQGGNGCISVTSNVVPKLYAAFIEACLGGQYDKALNLNDQLYPLHRCLFLETSPAPIKYAASLLGLCTAHARLPMLPVNENTANDIKKALKIANTL